MKLKYDFTLTEVCGEQIAIPVGDSAMTYHGVLNLNETGAAIFKLLQQGDDEQAIAAKLQQQYSDTDPQKITACVSEFLNELKQGGVLE